MELYLLKSACILAILFGFYKLALENETMHGFKRFYLLGSLPAAFLIPMVTFTSYVEVPVRTGTVIVATASPVTVAETTVNPWTFILWSLYTLGVVFFSIKFGKNLTQLISKIRNNPKIKRNSISHVLLQSWVIPHTFLNYVFLNKQKFEAREIPDEVIQHEHVHARQKHSVDLLVVELLQIVFWFNPLLYLIKRSIKLNHEFLADRAVLNQGTNATVYQTLILAYSSHATTPTLANSINYSFIKKRFTVMKKQTSKQAIWLRSFLLLPLLAILLYGFSTKEVIQKEVMAAQVQTELQQEKATKAEVEEYNALAKKYNAMSENRMKIVTSEVNRMRFIYRKMTAEQKEAAEAFPRFSTPPPPPAPPAAPDAPDVEEIPPAPPVPAGPKGEHLPPAPTAPSAIETGKTPPVPPMPAPAPDPAWHIEKLQQEGATFFYEGKEIDYKRALEVVEKNSSFRLEVKKSDDGTPVAILSGGC